MPITITAEDAQFLQRVAELVEAGRTQEQIAEVLDLPASTLRYRVRELGFKIARRTELEARPQFGGRPFTEMLADGEILVGQPVTA